MRYLKRKRIVETEAWDDLSSHEHAHAFTVAHSMHAGILNDTLGLLIQARESGQSYEEFKKRFRALMKHKGWYGKDVNKQTSERYMNWRTRLIYGVNMRTARAAGAYRQQLQAAQLRPYLVYKSMLYGQTRRDTHKRMHNVALPVEHEFWKEHYPPNGWGCQCYVVSAREEDIEAKGYRKHDGVAAGVVTNSTPREWKQNAGLEAYAPRFSQMPYLQQHPSLMKEVARSYAEDMRGSALTRGEFAALAERLSDYGDAKLKPNVPVLVGAMRDEVWEAMQQAAPDVDVKLNATTADIMHAVRVGKVHRVPTTKLVHVWDVMQNPDVVYRQGDGNIVFFKEWRNNAQQFKEAVNVAFRVNDRGTALHMRSFNYFTREKIKSESVKGGKILYESKNK